MNYKEDSNIYTFM